MRPIAAGIDYLDLQFLGQPEVIATAVLHGPAGIALIDPGPSTTSGTLERILASRGMSLADVRAILLTHIHLDHAGSTGSLMASCPHAEVVVHARGAPHLIDPSKLLASASRLYGADMDRLWGEVRPVPAGRVRAIAPESAPDGAVDPQRTTTIEAAGHEIEIAWTPGHASHHVSYYLPAARMAFVGDVAGICRPSGRVVLPATPPPDIDLEAWRASTRRILAWNPESLFITHFGPQPGPRGHVQDLWRRMDDWSARVRALLASPAGDADRAAIFMREVFDELQRATSRGEADAYVSAGRFDFSYTGLARYWARH
jgi:glyoxylase-like metal-dependent hydrolase (beta-lactamase superfamily II)